MAARRVAFYGGSFDPPHLGHLAVARAARDLLELDLVLFAPVGCQPLKPQGAGAGFPDRVEMTRLAVCGERGFEVSLVDAPKAGAEGIGKANFTIETLARLRAELPADFELFQLMGADSFRSLRSWHRAAEIPFAADLIVASRPGEPLEDLARLLPEGLELYPSGVANGGESRLCEFTISVGSDRSARFFLLNGLHFDISASGIRGDWKSAREMLPAGVTEYIGEHHLYGC